jgi:glutathione S-transferase
LFNLEAPTMKLYYSPLSTYSQKAMIAFNEKGIAYEPQLVDLFSAEGRAAYAKINPLGKVPFFKPSDDWEVPESTSIIEYLEDKFPNTPRLIPAGGGDAARQVRFMDRMSDFYLNNPIVDLLFQKLGFRAKDDDKAAKMRGYATMTYEHLDKRLANQPWLCGESFTMADCAAIPPLFYAQTALPFDAYPNLVAYFQRAQQRPSYAKVRAEFEPIWQGMMK